MGKNGKRTPRCNYIINLGNGGKSMFILLLIEKMGITKVSLIAHYQFGKWGDWKMGSTEVSLITKRFLSVVSAIDP